ncbi:hypothetical protein BHM03_00036628 [Ensete ventricosum]|nr:hypothetical protein BHM03_00036628 [Ensete ventricosum]
MRRGAVFKGGGEGEPGDPAGPVASVWDHETMNIKKEKPAKLKQISQVHPTFPSHGEQLSLRAHTAFSGLEMFRLIAFQVFSSDVTMG